MNMNINYGLREKKKALLKLNMLEILVQELHTKRFETIKVKDICHALNISEVTFFNYFRKKEELLQFYMKVWNYKRELSIQKEGRKKGISGIYKIFDDIANTEDSNAIMLAFISYYVKLEKEPDEVTLSDCEKWLLNESYSVKEISLDEQLFLHAEEAKELGEVSVDISTDQLVELFGSLYYGTPIMTHITRGDLGELYKQNIDTIIKIWRS